MTKIIERPDLQTAFENIVRVWQKQNMRCETDVNELIGRMLSLVERAEWKTVNSWIPVEDALPELDTMVIVCYYGSDCIFPMQGETVTEAIARQNKVPTVTTGYLDEEGWNGADMFPMMIRPTFWMPLPEPPESEVQNNANN